MIDIQSSELDLSRVVVIVGEGSEQSTFVIDGNTSIKDTFAIINKRRIPLHRVTRFSVHTDRSTEPEFMASFTSNR